MILKILHGWLECNIVLKVILIFLKSFNNFGKLCSFFENLSDKYPHSRSNYPLPFVIIFVGLQWFRCKALIAWLLGETGRHCFWWVKICCHWFLLGGILMRTFELRLNTRFGKFRQKLWLKYSYGKLKKEWNGSCEGGRRMAPVAFYVYT